MARVRCDKHAMMNVLSSRNTRTHELEHMQLLRVPHACFQIPSRIAPDADFHAFSTSLKRDRIIQQVEVEGQQIEGQQQQGLKEQGQQERQVGAGAAHASQLITICSLYSTPYAIPHAVDCMLCATLRSCAHCGPLRTLMLLSVAWPSSAPVACICCHIMPLSPLARVFSTLPSDVLP